MAEGLPGGGINDNGDALDVRRGGDPLEPI